MYFLKPPKSFTDKSSTKYAFIPYLANPQSWRHEQVPFVELYSLADLAIL